jgi:hypothetical protein
MCIFLVVVVVCGGIDASSKPADDQYTVLWVLELLFAIYCCISMMGVVLSS